MYGQLYDYQRRWIEKENISIIHLIRQNVFKKHLSYLTKQKRGIAHSTVNIELVKVFCDPSTIIEILDYSIKSQNKRKEIFPDNPYIEITYEAFLNNYAEPYKKILSFLGVKQWAMPQSKLKKLNSDSLRGIIENYDEVASVFKGTLYEKLLD